MILELLNDKIFQKISVLKNEMKKSLKILEEPLYKLKLEILQILIYNGEQNMGFPNQL